MSPMSSEEATDFHPLVAVDDWGELSRRYQVLADVLRLPGDGTLRLVRPEGWVAVPSEDFDHDDLPSLVAQCEEEARQWLWGLTLEELAWKDPHRSWPAGFEVPATLAGLQAFLSTIAVLHYALLPHEAAWTVLSLGRADCSVVLGTPETVERLLQRPVERAFAEFEAYADEWRGTSPGTAEELSTILVALRDGYLSLAPGEVLSLEAPWATWRPPTAG